MPEVREVENCILRMRFIVDARKNFRSGKIVFDRSSRLSTQKGLRLNGSLIEGERRRRGDHRGRIICSGVDFAKKKCVS